MTAEAQGDSKLKTHLAHALISSISHTFLTALLTSGKDSERSNEREKVWGHWSSSCIALSPKDGRQSTTFPTIPFATRLGYASRSLYTESKDWSMHRQPKLASLQTAVENLNEL